MNDDRLAISLSEWCRRTGMSKSTADRKIAAGELAAVQIGTGGNRLIPIWELDRFKKPEEKTPVQDAEHEPVRRDVQPDLSRYVSRSASVPPEPPKSP